ncbi:MAG: transposase [Phycisphaeraceae bacterium]|nr:transposase [Phycisphaeraceae bacterium]
MNKFDDHLRCSPPRRDLQTEHRHQPLTMCGWLMGCVAAAEPVYKLMHSRICDQVVQTDGSTLPMMEPGRGSTQASGFWVYREGDLRRTWRTTSRDRTAAGRNSAAEGVQRDTPGRMHRRSTTTSSSTRRGSARVVEAGCCDASAAVLREVEAGASCPGNHGDKRWIRKLYAIEDEPEADVKQRRRPPSTARIASGAGRLLRGWTRSSRVQRAKAPARQGDHADAAAPEALSRYASSGRLAIDNNASNAASSRW